MATLIAGIVILAVGTYGFRLSGRVLNARITFPPRARKLVDTAAVVMLAALVAVSALTTGHAAAGFARPAGVAVAGLLAWRKAPFIVIVFAAAGTAAILRLCGVT